MEELGLLAIGAVVGAVLASRIRPLLLGAATAGYKVADAVSARTSEQWKGVEGFFTEAREKARKPEQPVIEPAKA